MKARVDIRPIADRDLGSAFDYIAQKSSPEVATRFFEASYRAFNDLLQMPGMGAPHPHSSPRLAGLRRWPVPGFRSYLIFYREADEGIEVLRVLHGARDLDSILFEN
jgi:toxin ParE1/3/4